jgi:hypothetical protein
MAVMAASAPDTHPREHLIQAYTDDAFLARVVGEYLATGLAHGEAAVIVATPAHTRAFTEQLALRGVDVAATMAAGRLVCLDADGTLRLFKPHGRIDRPAFLGVVTAALDHVRASGSRRVRLSGEVVELLWREQLADALELERLWNEVLVDERLSLLCAYRIDALERQAHGVLRQVTHCHGRLLPPAAPERFEAAVERAYAEVFGITGDVTALRELMIAQYSRGAAVSPAQAALFALDDMPPLIANDIRTRAGRHYRGEIHGHDARH